MKPHIFLLIFSHFLSFSRIFSAPLPLQLIALLSLKSSLNDPLSSLKEWSSSSATSCSWSGVQCDPKTYQVTSLDLSQRNLSGRIPPQIQYLSRLSRLNLSQNAFDSPFPATIFELSQLTSLDISHNNFNSSFPPGISKLKFLTLFNAYSNSFTGPLPGEVSRLGFLEHLNLGGSYFSGNIPASYGTFPRLKFLYLAGNVLDGPIPGELGSLAQLEHMEMGYNEFTGGVPVEFGSLEGLKYLDISSANLSGHLAPELGNLESLETFLLFKNHFSGEIPTNFSKLQALKVLDLSDNKLSGKIPQEFSSLKSLTALSLMNNQLSGEIPSGIGELADLETILLWNNSLNGIIPETIGSNAKLQKLDVSSNSLSGPMPRNLCLGNKLIKLLLFNNQLQFPLPKSIANCTSLLRLRIQNNSFNGTLPYGFGFLPNLTYMDISSNEFTDSIPTDIGNAMKLQYLNISDNNFDSELPKNMWSAPSLQIFSASRSGIVGPIPDFVGCGSFYKIELEGNLLNGSIPWDIGHCEKLICLNLRYNSLSGIIPWEISTLPAITDVDLSHNFLTGSIPSNFENCTTLENFNVSYNLLSGPIPSASTTFSSLHPSSFAGNNGLCGEVLKIQCSSDTRQVRSEESSPPQAKKTAGAIVWIMAAAFAIGLFMLIAGSRCFKANYSRRFTSHREIGPWKLTSFQRLNFTADEVIECLSSSSNKILGMGSTGTVYKAEMPSGDIIAVKKLWGRQKEMVIRKGRDGGGRGCVSATASATATEVEVLGNVRHRNIVRLLGWCSNKESTMLLYEYMPHGSLDDLLHGKGKDENLVANWVTRYKIALGVAQGICYLHHDCDPVIVHRDLKPSNILLDHEMEARVADFGVAKLIQSDECMSVIAGSYGYIAPEYAYTLQVDEKSDIYSYGVVLMEILSGKRSVESEFGDGNSIVDWVRTKIKTKDGASDILDKNAGASCFSVREEMMLLLRVALLCTSRNPADRPSMRDVVSMLLEAKPKRKLPESGGGGGGGGGGVCDAPPGKPILDC